LQPIITYYNPLPRGGMQAEGQWACFELTDREKG
jgi:hypothetical protein